MQSKRQKTDKIPAFGFDRPVQYWDVPDDKIEEDIFLTSDSCVIAERFFFIRGCLELPILGTDDWFEWGVWVSLKEENFFTWQDNYEVTKRSHIVPFFGWLSSQIPIYPDTQNMKTMVHIRDNGIRPYIKLEENEHPLSTEQHNGISRERVHEIVRELHIFQDIDSN